jgi:DNA invertase Pin-like site-specific DNA recombinase
MRAAIYARVSKLEGEPENQLAELRAYAASRGWQVAEYVDRGVSGARESRPELDRMLQDVRRRKVDVVCCWRLDRLGRNLKHLVTLITEFEAQGVGFVSLGENIDCTTPAGKLQLHILAALAEFERGRIVERVKAGLGGARTQGRGVGRPKSALRVDRLAAVSHLSLAQAAAALGVSRSTLKRWRRGQKSVPAAA